MKQVSIFIPYLSGYGGTEKVIYNIIKQYLINKPHLRINIYSIGGFHRRNFLHFPNVKIIQLPNNNKLRKFIYLFLLPIIIPYFIIKISPEIVISTTPVMWTLAKLFIKIFRLNTVVIAWYHYSFKAKPVPKFCLKMPDYFLAISKSAKKELCGLGINPKKVYVIYNPIIPSARTIRHSKNYNHFVYVGRIEFCKQKNLREMFIALSRIHKDWLLDVYGVGMPDDITRLESLSKKLHISHKIRFKGFVNNVFDNISNADALLLTSNYEGLPMTIAEAIAHGLYVISANCPDGPSELINDENGNLYQMHNITQLVRLLNKVIKGKKNLNQSNIKKSISFMYVNNYFHHLIHVLSKISK